MNNETTNITVVGDLVPTTYDIVCKHCNVTGTLTYQAPRIASLTVGGVINFTNVNCSNCGNEGGIYAPTGTYVRDDKTGRMNRQV